MSESNATHHGYPLTEVFLSPPEPKPERPDGMVVGTLVGFTEDGLPRVAFSGQPTGDPLPARTTAVLELADVGGQVVLAFESGDWRMPIVLGKIMRPQPERPPVEAKADDKRLVFTAEEQIEFRCGDASLILTKAGKILLRGKYLLSRSSGVNRIKGGSVQIN